jgi:hypothetical protein
MLWVQAYVTRAVMDAKFEAHAEAIAQAQRIAEPATGASMVYATGSQGVG